MNRFRLLLVLPLLLVLAGPAHAQFPTYGLSVAVADGEVLVGQPLSFDGPGTVFVYRRTDTGSWVETAQLVSPQPFFGDGFGMAVALDGDRLLVGASSQSPFPDAPPPAAFVHERDAGGAWQRTARLVLDTPVPTFGLRVALDGDVALVSAIAEDQGAGSVYVFRHAGGTWTQEARLRGADVEAGHRFGMALAIDGHRAVIGAPGHGGSGAAYVFHREGSGWQEAAKLTGSGLADGAGLGSAVHVDGDRVLVGAPAAHNGIGAVLAFGYDAEEEAWEEQQHLRPFAAEPGARYGAAFAPAGPDLFVGAPAGAAHMGAAHLLRGGTDGWAGAEVRHGADPQRANSFGTAVASNGRLVAVSAPGSDYSLGRVVVFERQTDGWNEVAALFETTAPMPSVTGARVPCDEGGAGAFGCDGVDLVSFLSVEDLGGTRGVIVNDLWGWTDAETGKEYAIVGRNDGTVFVDLSDPARPVNLGFLPRTEGSPAATWRDVKVYQDHAFIVADGSGAHGMQVFDLRRLRDVENPPQTFAPDVRYDRIHSAHNIAINEATATAFAIGSSQGGETCGGGLHMIDISTPTAPAFVGCFSHAGTGNNQQGSTHDAQCVLYNGPDTEHQGREICFGSNETALSIADVTDRANPVALAKATYPKIAYTHQGWLTEDHRYFFLNDEGDEMAGLVEGTRTLIWDVADLDDPVLVREYISDSRAVDHNLYIRGNLMYQANYVSGLRIFDVTDPANPELVGYFDTVPGEDSAKFRGAWSSYPYFESGLVIVTSMREGLFVLQKKEVDL